VATVVHGDFERDDVKAASNLTKHAISFEEAATVFADPKVLVFTDGGDDGRLVALGFLPGPQDTG
jgi:uncharacterized DUF497 family protein